MNYKILSIICCVAIVQGCAESEQASSPKPRGVLFETVNSGSEVKQRIYSGITQAHLDAKLSFKVPGNVVERLVSVGDKVEAGQLIARLDIRDYTTAVETATANVAASEAQQRQAEANYERLIGLYESRDASQSELEVARAQAESWKARTSASKQQLRQAKLQLSYTQLKAPEQCDVAETYVKSDENVDAGQPVVRLVCGSCPEVRVSIPQTQIQEVHSGMKIQVDVAGQTTSYDAVVSEVGVAAASGATFPVTAVLTGNCPSLRSGVAADARFEFSNTNKDEITVPSVSVGEDENGKYVFVLTPAEGDQYTANKRVVEVGRFTEEARFIINSGLNNEEIVVTAGVRRIQDGQVVRLIENWGK